MKKTSEITVIPPSKGKSKCSTGCVFDNSVKRIEKGRFTDHPHNIYHRNAMLATAQAACWMVLSGLELTSMRQAVAHGDWVKWVEDNCEFSLTTARNYIEIATQIKSKALKSVRKDRSVILHLLNKSAAELTRDEQHFLLQAVHKLTDGATIQQLYLDYGITKKPQGSGCTGGDTSGAAGDDVPDPNSPEEKAKLLIIVPYNDFVEQFYATGANNIPRWTHLPRKELESIDATLLDMRNSIKEALKGK